METDKIIVIDTCALLPNCQKEDNRFYVNKRTNYLNENNEYELCITPFTLYEILTLNDEQTKINLFEYLEKNNIKALSYRKFIGGKLNFSMASDKDLLTHLKKLVIFECNILLEPFIINWIFSKYGSLLDVDKIKAILDNVNDFYDLDKKAGEVDNLKTRLDNDYFEEYFARISNPLKKNLNVEISYSEFLNFYYKKKKSFFSISFPVKVNEENLMIFQYILNMSSKRKKKHKMINYLIDALNIHAALLKDLNAYFITRDNESIKFFNSIEGIGFDIEDKTKFLNNFLITKSN